MDYEKIDGSLEVHSQRCHSWLCPVCREKRGRQVRAFLRERAELFEVPKLFTLTIDPKGFVSPLDAYLKVRLKGYIPRLMRFLGIRNWFCVLEFQKNGNPHWHILIDVASLPKVGHVPHYLDLEKVYSLWRDKWHFGSQVKLSEKHTESPEHAVNYICKYLIKSPSLGFPDWMWEQCGIRFFSQSKSIGSLSSFLSPSSYETKVNPPDQDEEHSDDDDVTEDESSDEDDSSEEVEEDEDDEECIRRHKLSNCLRVCYCGSRSFVLSDGRFINEIELPLEVLKDFDAFKLSQSEGADGTVYSSLVLDKMLAKSFMSSLDSLEEEVYDFIEKYAKEKAKKLGIEDILQSYAVPF